MIEGIHKHLLHELERAGRTETVFILAGTGFNLLMLAISWSLSDDVSRQRRRSVLLDSQSWEKPIILIFASSKESVGRLRHG